MRGIRGEPATPDDPAHGLVWSAIVGQADLAQSESEFVSTEDTPREVLARHPWNIGGGGAADVQEAIEEGASAHLGSCIESIGFYQDTHADDAFVQSLTFCMRHGLRDWMRPQVRGEDCRDWTLSFDEAILFPYDSELTQWHDVPRDSKLAWFWSLRTLLWSRTTFGGGTYRDASRPWFDYHQFPIGRARTARSIAFGEVATHNHFVFDRGGKVFNRTSPVIKLPTRATEDDHLRLLALLNSSTACFWLKQVCYPKGGDHVGQEGARVQKTKWDERYAFNGTNIERFPIVSTAPLDLARRLDQNAIRLAENRAATVAARAIPTRESLDQAQATAEAIRATMIALQEELDWHCCRLYGLLDDALEHPNPPPLRLGERAFEIVMARQIAAGELETAWFARHNSAPITELPQHWPADYRTIVECRIALIGTNPTIGLIERPEYKRRWSSEPWETLERNALRDWLLDRLEDPRCWPASETRLMSIHTLADAVRADEDFVSVAALYAGDTAFNLETLIAELVTREAVPFLAPLRYGETGLRKRADWEATWDKQRQEDAIDADVAREQWQQRRERWVQDNPRQDGETNATYQARMQAALADPAITTTVQSAIDRIARERKQEQIGTIPVPPKYRTPDFLSADFWRLRGGLDVPKERFVSFLHCARDADGSLPVLWAGYDHLARAKAIAAWYVERKDTDGWPAPRLIPLLAGLLELVPWLRQWHNDIDPATGVRMGDYFAEFIDDECRSLGLNLADLREWKPPASTRRPRGRRAAA